MKTHWTEVVSKVCWILIPFAAWLFFSGCAKSIQVVRGTPVEDVRKALGDPEIIYTMDGGTLQFWHYPTKLVVIEHNVVFSVGPKS